jgi:hypothetical protein
MWASRDLPRHPVESRVGERYERPVPQHKRLPPCASGSRDDTQLRAARKPARKYPEGRHVGFA